MTSKMRCGQLILTLFLATIPALAQMREPGLYTGTIGDNLDVLMTLNGTDSAHIGHYFYTRRGGWIDLAGSFDPEGYFYFTEANENDPEPTGFFSGSSTEGHFELNGNWISPNGKRLSFTAAKIARFDSVGRRRVDGFEFSSIYPQFFTRSGASMTALNDRIIGYIGEAGQRVEAEIEDGDVSFSQSSDEETSEFVPGAETIWFSVQHYSDDLIGMAMTVERTGGAHPSYSYTSLNYGIDGADTRQIHVGDLFKRGSDYQRVIAKILYDEVKRSGYPCMEYINREDFQEAEVLESFVITGYGLLYRLWPGPHACGSAPDIAIPYTKLAKVIDPKGPLGRFIEKKKK